MYDEPPERPDIDEAKQVLADEGKTSVTVAEEHHCGSELELSEDLEEYGGGHVLLCPRCMDRVRKV